MDKEGVGPCRVALTQQSGRIPHGKKTEYHPDILGLFYSGKYVLHDWLENYQCSYGGTTVLKTVKLYTIFSLSEFDYSNFSILTKLTSAKKQERSYIPFGTWDKELQYYSIKKSPYVHIKNEYKPYTSV